MTAAKDGEQARVLQDIRMKWRTAKRERTEKVTVDDEPAWNGAAEVACAGRNQQEHTYERDKNARTEVLRYAASMQSCAWTSRN